MRNRTCASCGTRFSGSQCTECGSASSDGKPQYSVMVGDAVVDTGCRYNDHGERCQRRGAVSSSTNGMGPWYCSEHFWRLHGREDLAAKQDQPKPPKTGHVSETLEAMK